MPLCLTQHCLSQSADQEVCKLSVNFGIRVITSCRDKDKYGLPEFGLLRTKRLLMSRLSFVC